MPLEFYEPWLRFKHNLVRQLAFSIASPNLLRQWPEQIQPSAHIQWHSDHFWQQQFECYLPRLLQLDQQPQALLDFLSSSKSTRLGIRFEQLLLFWLKDSQYHPFELLGHRIQQRQEKLTLGELDFLIRNHESGQIEHWEVAIKFYLAEGTATIADWYGLNREDNLKRKLQHFAHQQFRFDQVLGFEIQQRFAVMKGQLYWPQHNHFNAHISYADAKQTALATPNWINVNRRSGVWSNRLPLGSAYRLQRSEWLCHNAQQSSAPPHWYTNGLYKCMHNEAYYMLRLQPHYARQH